MKRFLFGHNRLSIKHLTDVYRTLPFDKEEPMQAATTTEQQTIIPEIHPDEVIDFMNIDETDFG